jgi:hypothetical protein
LDGVEGAVTGVDTSLLTVDEGVVVCASLIVAADITVDGAGVEPAVVFTVAGEERTAGVETDDFTAAAERAVDEGIVGDWIPGLCRDERDVDGVVDDVGGEKVDGVGRGLRVEVDVDVDVVGRGFGVEVEVDVEAEGRGFRVEVEVDVEVEGRGLWGGRGLASTGSGKGGVCLLYLHQITIILVLTFTPSFCFTTAFSRRARSH